MSESEHEPARFISDIQIPADLKAVHRLEHNPEADINRQRPPAEAQMSIRVIHAVLTVVILSEAKNLAIYPARLLVRSFAPLRMTGLCDERFIPLARSAYHRVRDGADRKHPAEVA